MHSTLPSHRPEGSESATTFMHRSGGDQDSGFHESNHAAGHGHHNRTGGQHKCVKHRSRPCVACHHTPVKGKTDAPVFKTAFKAGTTASKTADDLVQIVKRRQSYRAPKPPPLTSHARFVRGTLAPPLSLGCRTDPVVLYPDFKRLDSTYRLSYGAHHLQQQQQHRQRTKSLTTLLNEKSSRVWKS